MPNANDLLSIGQVSADLQIPVRLIEVVVAELHIEPALRLNHIVHFDAQAVEQIAERIRASRQPMIMPDPIH